MDFKSKFEGAMNTEAFYSTLGGNKKLHDLHFNRISVDEYKQKLDSKLPNLKIIVLTEPWCGDSIAIVPTMMRLFENNANVDMRFLLRDENPDLMDLFLTNGSRSIPKIIILDDEFRVLTHWGPRPKIVQDIFESFRADIEAGRVEKMEAIKKIRGFYSKDPDPQTQTELEL